MRNRRGGELGVEHEGVKACGSELDALTAQLARCRSPVAVWCRVGWC